MGQRINGRYYTDSEIDKIRKNTSDDEFKEFLTSGLIGYVAGDVFLGTLAGGLLGGSFVGGLLGGLLGDD